jgi:nicotinamide-nucleotide amidase
MNAEIVTSGTELLLGEIVDTNSTYIARALRDIGVNIYYKTSVGDNAERMALVLDHALARADVVVTTGGLGPTVDDVTRDAVALCTHQELVLYPECLEQIETMFERWGRKMGVNNRRQAYLPAGSIPINNPVGTAPGFIVNTERGTIIALPGVPREMEHLMQTVVLPYLSERMGSGQLVIKAKVLRTAGIGESLIDEQIDDLMRSSNPTVGLAAHTGAVDIRITARAADVASADAMIAMMESKVRAVIEPDGIFGYDTETLEQATGRLLARAGVRLALLESNTAGEIATMLRSTAEGRSALAAELVVSSAEALEDQLHLGAAKLASYGWVSEMSAAAAAAGLCDTYEPGWGVAVLGDMTAQDDVYGTQTGQTFVAIFTPDRTVVRRFPYGGSGVLARRRLVVSALDMIRREGFLRWQSMQKEEVA